MNSSTSSSRKVYLKIWLVCFLGMAGGLLLVRVFGLVVGASGEEFIARPLMAIRSVPQMLEEKAPHVIVYGSSMTESGFSPRQMDRQFKERGIDVKSFNFGFGGLNPYFQDYLSRRMKESYLENDRRVALSLIEFNPFQTTKTRYNNALPAMDAYIGMLATPEELWEIAKDDPTRGALIYNIRYLRDNISAEMITFFFGRAFREGRPKPDMEPESEALVKRRRKLDDLLTERFKEDFPDYEYQPWSMKYQGASTIAEERSEETLQLLSEYFETRRSDYRMTADKMWREQSADITHLDFEEELVQAFIRTVENFKEFSDHVEIVLLPKNSEWIVNPPEALERQRQVLERIQKATGVRIRNYQHLPTITGEMYTDTTHLSRYFGAPVFTEQLVNDYEPVLKRITKSK